MQWCRKARQGSGMWCYLRGVARELPRWQERAVAPAKSATYFLVKACTDPSSSTHSLSRLTFCAKRHQVPGKQPRLPPHQPLLDGLQHPGCDWIGIVCWLLLGEKEAGTLIGKSVEPPVVAPHSKWPQTRVCDVTVASSRIPTFSITNRSVWQAPSLDVLAKKALPELEPRVLASIYGHQAWTH